MRILLSIKPRTMAVLLLWVLALAPAIAQTLVHQGETSELSVGEIPYDTYTWELYNDPNVNFAVVPGMTLKNGEAEFVGVNTGPTVNVIWNKPGLYFVKVTARDVSGCTNNVKVIIIRVLNALPTGIIAAGRPVCEKESIALTVTLTGTTPWSFTYTDGATEWTVTSVLTDTYVIDINPAPKITTQYWITRVTDIYGINSAPGERTLQQVNPLPAPSNIYHR